MNYIYGEKSINIERKRIIMKIKRMELSDCEKVAMKCIWDAREPVTCQEIREEMETRYGLEYSSTTVYTLLNSLQKKGFAGYKKRGVNFYYALKDKEDYQAEELAQAKSFWFNNSSSSMITALVKAGISEEERKEIRKLIDELD